MVKRCTLGTCIKQRFWIPRTFNKWSRRSNSDISSFSDGEETKNEEMLGYVRAAGKSVLFAPRTATYVCSLRFIDKKGPTKQYPDPVPATAGRDRVSMWSVDISYECIYVNNARVYEPIAGVADERAEQRFSCWFVLNFSKSFTASFSNRRRLSLIGQSLKLFITILTIITWSRYFG